jgi:hypothetical protein
VPNLCLDGHVRFFVESKRSNIHGLILVKMLKYLKRVALNVFISNILIF